MNTLPASQSDGDGGPKCTTCLERLCFLRTKRLLVRAYILFLAVSLVLAGIVYLERPELLRLRRPNWAPLPVHPHYIIFKPPSSPHPPPSDQPLQSMIRLPDACLESHFALGYPCFNKKPINFDIVWTWVNGSDPQLQKAMTNALISQNSSNIEGSAKTAAAAVSMPPNKLYRDHDELRHSFRSVLQHFRPYTNRFHLLASDFPYTASESTNSAVNQSESVGPQQRAAEFDVKGEVDKPPLPTDVIRDRTFRIGQLPSWLSAEEQGHWNDGTINVTITYHAQVFEDYTGTTFNSYGIESQLHNLPYVQQNIIYLNDDFFFTSDLEASDFYTSTYGMVFRMDPTLAVNPIQTDPKADPAGEWGPLGYSNWLLSERFGSRSRPYLIHAAKYFSAPILDEVARIWQPEFAATAAHKFRGMRDEGGVGDAYVSFLATHFVVERWREALLWSWVVGRIGGDNDEWGEKEQRLAWQELGGDVEALGVKIPVNMTLRKAAQEDRVLGVLQAAGQGYSGKTKYTFSSEDGYPYSYRTRYGKAAWPVFSGNHIGQQLCTLDYHECIASTSSASAAFRMIAFQKPVQCGDCIIHALRSSSGVLGLSAFLSPRMRVIKSSISPSLVPSSSFWEQLLQSDVGDDDAADDVDPGEDDPLDEEAAPAPHLPLVSHWTESDFSLKGVLEPYGAVNVRAWTMRLLERYRFVIGDTSIVFLMIDSVGSAMSGLRRVTPDVALLCMNDDVKRDNARVDNILRDWQHRRWRHPAKWER